VSRAGIGVYDRWARYYDILYRDLVDFEGDVDFLEKVFRRYGVSPKNILDLGCGTGNHDFLLASRGYQVTGVDRSAHMLSFAQKKAPRKEPRPRFVLAGMESFRLGRTFDAAICMFGAFGYLARRSDAVRCLRRVRSHLAPRGPFVFEYWQTTGVRPGTQSWLDCKGDGLQVLRLSEGTFDSRRSLLAIDFHFLVLRSRRVVDRFTERHVIRTYTRGEMRALLRESGFSFVGEFAGTPGRKGFTRVTASTFRIMAVARRGES
jgi:SAM-dependent methyltransferase